jgi:predicted DNA-binding protein (MmcQ/YjbR family)
MSIEDLMTICRKLKGMTTDIKWEDHLCFNVGEKIFLITSPDSVPPTASFKVKEEDFDRLTEREGIDQARYFARRKWVSVDDIDRLTNKEWEQCISESYRLVVSTLTRKKRSELGIDQDSN